MLSIDYQHLSNPEDAGYQWDWHIQLIEQDIQRLSTVNYLLVTQRRVARNNLADGAANQYPLDMKPRDIQPNKRDVHLIN
jgi:hypothetical protein